MSRRGEENLKLVKEGFLVTADFIPELGHEIARVLGEQDAGFVRAYLGVEQGLAEVPVQFPAGL
jgi:hypothetical protein